MGHDASAPQEVAPAAVSAVPRLSRRMMMRGVGGAVATGVALGTLFAGSSGGTRSARVAAQTFVLSGTAEFIPATRMVRVTLADDLIDVDRVQVNTGVVLFVIENRSTMHRHRVQMEGTGLLVITADIYRDEYVALRVLLPHAGVYTLTAAGYEQRGMKTTIEAVGPDATAASATATFITAAPATAMPTRPPPAAAAGAGGDVTVDVGAKDFAYTLDRSAVPAGSVTFVVRNSGPSPHTFNIRGNGAARGTGVFGAGETATLTVDLAPGRYTYFCSIPGHEQLGMIGVLTVT